jgi:preprotein translocase subunit SecF
MELIMERKNIVFIFMGSLIVALIFVIIFINGEEKQHLSKKNTSKIEKNDKKLNDAKIKEIIIKKEYQSQKIKKLKKERRIKMLKEIREKFNIAEKEYRRRANLKNTENGSSSTTSSNNANEYTGSLVVSKV